MSSFDAILKKWNELKFLQGESYNQLSLVQKAILFCHAINLASGQICLGQFKFEQQTFDLPVNWAEARDSMYSFCYRDQNNQKTVQKFLTTFDEGVVGVSSIGENCIIQWQFRISEINLTNEDQQKMKDFSALYFEQVIKQSAKFSDSSQEKKQMRAQQKDQTQVEQFWDPSHLHQPQKTQLPFGNYGASDLDIVYPHQHQILNSLQQGQNIPINSGGNLLGPNNPIFNGGNLEIDNPRIRFDPYGPEPGMEPFSLGGTDDFIPAGLRDYIPGFQPKKPGQASNFKKF